METKYKLAFYLIYKLNSTIKLQILNISKKNYHIFCPFIIQKDRKKKQHTRFSTSYHKRKETFDAMEITIMFSASPFSTLLL